MTARRFVEDEAELHHAVDSHCNFDVRQNGRVAVVRVSSK
jgi:hypothetical protein